MSGGTVATAMPSPCRARATVTPRYPASGAEAVTASTRTHAARRCFGARREYVVAITASPCTPATVPVSVRPSSSATRTSTVSPGPPPASTRLAAPRPPTRLGPARRHEPLDRRLELLDHGLAEQARRQVAAGDLRAIGGAEVAAVEPRVEQPLADVPLLEAVEVDRQRVVQVGREIAEAEPEPAAQERADRVLDEAHEVVELDDRRALRHKRLVQEGWGV